MSKINAFDLISGLNIAYGICTLHPPTLDEIRNVGYNKFNTYLNIIMMDKDTYIDNMGIKAQFESYDEEFQLKYTVFDLLIITEDIRQILQEALSFFIVEDIKFNELELCFNLYSKNSNKQLGHIDRTNFEEFQDGIAQINFLNKQESSPKKFANKKAKEIYEKILKGRKETAKTKPNEDMSLPNLISAISTFHNSYNFTNIWSLTVYQLYDQFFRLFGKVQLDVLGLRWAAWGKEDFDFKVWFKDPNIK